MIGLLRTCFTIWAVFIAFLAFGGYALLIPFVVAVFFFARKAITERKHKKTPLAKRNLIKRS